MNLRTVESKEVDCSSSARKSTMVFSNNFTLFYSAKSVKPSKHCNIADLKDENTDLTIHEQQAVIEAAAITTLFYLDDHNKKPVIKAEDFYGLISVPSTNFLIANIGCVISDIPHKKGGNHKRVFITSPIFIEESELDKFNHFLYARREKSNDKHSEYLFIEYLKKEHLFRILIDDLCKINSVESHNGFTKRKIYSLVFDLHSSQVVCEDCEGTISAFQESCRESIKKILKDYFIISNKEGVQNKFNIIFRISAVRDSSYSGFRSNFNTNISDVTLDLNKPMNSLLIHSDVAMREGFKKWYHSNSYINRSIILPKYTIFQNTGGYFRTVLPNQLSLIKTSVSEVSKKAEKENDVELKSNQPK